ncbi:LysR family transcriptional regulator [Paenibacillus sp. YYML68]|uniref:LysR family transcriptional regulator n=1 Tax=Paenibacillus sp. YYML68 TaxID=2909250 RepID=UPI00248F9FAB|nr:LysR family transcriptional regulator [Paenibacillus sp. YYML68]
MLDRLEGRYFRTFVTVMEEGSISRAAEKLGYVQSTVTTHIRLLEESVGRRLFERLPRGVVLTEDGRRLSAYARRFLQLGDELEELLAETEQEPQGTVRVRLLESFGASYVWEPLRQFSERYPRIDIELEPGFQLDTIAALRERRVELGIVPLVEAQAALSDIEAVPLAADELIWIASCSRAELVRSEGAAALAGVRLVGFGPQCLYTGEADAILRQEEGHSATPQLETAAFASLAMIKQAVASGWGIAFVPRTSVRAELDSGVLVECPELGRRAIRHCLLRLKARPLPRAAELLHGHLAGCGLSGHMVE